jgi:uncharacterized protein YjbJ (UPF0337 family)
MALNQQTLQGNWNQIKGKLHERWGDLTDDDLSNAQGSVERLVGTIQERTGETRAAIEGYLEELSDSGGPAMKRAAETIRTYAEQAAGSVQDAAQHASESVQEGLHQTQDLVRRRPFESVMTCFGIGVVTGLIVGCMVRSSR